VDSSHNLSRHTNLNFNLLLLTLTLHTRTELLSNSKHRSNPPSKFRISWLSLPNSDNDDDDDDRLRVLFTIPKYLISELWKGSYIREGKIYGVQ
jgi:hypothetical protein